MRDLSSPALPGGKETDSDAELQRLRAEVSRYRQLFYFLAGVLAVVLLAGIVVSTILASHSRQLTAELRRQEEIAREQEAIATSVKDFLLQDLLEVSESPPK